tara:strand:- start:3288 stop:3809 length:522 start_codon:yes stop_codon:yes gene_type:complete
MDKRKFAMNYGAILGLALSLFSLLFWAANIDEKQSIIPSILNNALIIAFITYSVIQYRDQYNNKVISYSASLKLGTTIAFFSSIIMAFYTFFYISYLKPDLLSDVLHQTEQSILVSNPEISDENLDMQLEIAAKFMQPHWMMIMSMLGGTFMGFLYSALISLFTKKKDESLII